MIDEKRFSYEHENGPPIYSVVELDRETISDIISWSKATCKLQQSGFEHDKYGLGIKINASLSPIMKKEINGNICAVRAVSVFGETFIIVEKISRGEG